MACHLPAALTPNLRAESSVPMPRRRTPDHLERAPRLRVALVAPSLRILGGQAVQAERLLRAWEGDPEILAWLVPIDPVPAAAFERLTRIKYLRTLITQILYWPLLLRELRRADVVHVFSASYSSFLLSPLPAYAAARLVGKAVLINYRSGEAPDHLARSRIARSILRHTDTNVVPSAFLRDVFSEFGLHAEIIPNIVDLSRFRFAARRPIRPRLLSTRNLESLYNIDCTLRAFHIVQARYPEASLTVVGAGAEERRLRKSAADLRLSNVRFAGAVAPDEIWRYYADADVYVQTPNIDNMPSSVLEAFASGLPVVSTDAGGVPAIVTHGVDGLLAPIDDHVAVAESIIRLLGNQSLVDRLTAAALTKCDRYSWQAVRGQWLLLYRHLDQQRSCAQKRLSLRPLRAPESPD